MKKYSRTIPSEQVKIIEKLDFQVKGREFIIKNMLSGGTKFDNKIFKQYHDEYIDYFTQFEIAKNMINDKYIPEELNEDGSNWSLNYANCILTITSNYDGKVDGFN